MNWLKKLFQNKPEEKIISEKEIIPLTQATNQPDITISVSGKDKFVGIDYDFINLFYFKNEEEKTEFIESIQNILSRLKITEGMDYVTAHQKLTDYNYNSEEDPIPFLTDTLLFKSFIISKTESGGKTETREKPSDTKRDGIEKIKSYYSALNFCSVNLQRKIESNFFDFQFEEQLIDETLQKSDLFNYARIDTLFAFGHAYYKANNLNKMESTFDRIRSEKYDLGASTIANYYRSIGEIYSELKQNEKALDWLKAGLTLNPKLGVKKLVDRLEKK